MGVCLCLVKAMVCNQFFFRVLPLYAVRKNQQKKNIDSLFMANMVVKIVATECNPLVSYNSFCNRNSENI